MEDMPSDAESDEDECESGRPRDNDLNALTVPLRYSGKGPRPYRCAGVACSKTYKPRSRGRVFVHAKKCLKLNQIQRQHASRLSAASSPGAKVQAAADAAAVAASETVTSHPKRLTHAFFGPAAEAKVKDQLDFAILKLVCVAGMAPAILDLPEWKEVFHIAIPSYHPVSRTTMMDNHIPSEQERVRGLQIEYLQTQTRMTSTFDGGSLRNGESFYTIHVTTAERRVMLVEVQECTRVSHTADWIADVVTRVSYTFIIGTEQLTDDRYPGSHSNWPRTLHSCRLR